MTDYLDPMKVFKVLPKVREAFENEQIREERYTRIHIEEIEYQEQPATVIFFEDVTMHVA